MPYRNSVVGVTTNNILVSLDWNPGVSNVRFRVLNSQTGGTITMHTETLTMSLSSNPGPRDLDYVVLQIMGVRLWWHGNREIWQDADNGEIDWFPIVCVDSTTRHGMSDQ